MNILSDVRRYLNGKKTTTFILTIGLGLALFAGFEANQAWAQSATKPVTTEPAAKNDVKTTTAAKTEKKPAKEPIEASISLLTLFKAGGPFMWPLLLASIISLMVVLERLYYYVTVRLNKRSFQQGLHDTLSEGGLDSAADYLQTNSKLAISRILAEAVRISGFDPEIFSKGVEREASGTINRSERGLTVLAAISTLAPLIGFLGTVSGMIGAFDAIATADVVNAKVVAGGIKEALITTATGLIVAIPAMTFFQYFSGKVNGFATEVEQSANDIYKKLLQNQAGV